MLKRTPFLIRAVFKNGNVDALDQPDDKAEPEESIAAYMLKNKPGMCHIKSGKKDTSGFWPVATYVPVPEQPSDDIMRDSSKWIAWCETPQHRDRMEKLK